VDRVKRRASGRWPRRGREDARDQRARASCARSEQSGPAFGEQLLADGLESRPTASVEGGTRQSKLVEASTAAEIGQLKTDAPAVMIKREIVLGGRTPARPEIGTTPRSRFPGNRRGTAPR
jgi:hypothetical protein